MPYKYINMNNAKFRRELKRLQGEIDKLTEELRIQGENSIEITLKDINGRKTRPIEGIEFKNLVKNNWLKNIRYAYVATNNSCVYEIAI